MEKFYELQFAQKRGEVFFKFLEEYEEQDLKIGNFIPAKPLNVFISKGKRFYDFIRFQDPFNFAISKRVYELLKNNNITGWDSYEIIVEGRNDKYYGFQVLGRAGKLKRPDKPGFVIGCDFDYESWDKTDFFCPEETLALFCTEKVKKLLITNKVTNVGFEDISTIEWYSA